MRAIKSTDPAELACRFRFQALYPRLNWLVFENKERTAHHEAGHALVAHRLGWQVIYVVMKLDQVGHTERYQPRPEPPLDREQEERDYVTVGVAGYVAESIGLDHTIPWEALKLVNRVASRLNLDVAASLTFVEGAETRARSILESSWPTVERLIAELLAYRRLEGQYLASLLEGVAPYAARRRDLETPG